MSDRNDYGQNVENNMYVFFNNKTNEILSIVKLNDTPFDPQDFIRTHQKIDQKFIDLSLDDISYSFENSNEYDYYKGSLALNVDFIIDPNTKKLKAIIKPLVSNGNTHLTYNQLKIKRDFTFEDVYKMYNEDYINFNLKNMIKSGALRAEFMSIKDLNIRTHIAKKSWRYFFSDPYLEDYADDKLQLGRSIVEIGTYYPFLVGNMNTEEADKLYVFEGNHRIMSLKLLALHGEITEDYKVLCIVLPFDYEGYKNYGMYNQLSQSILTRYIIETKYGCDVINNQNILDKAIEDIQLTDGKMIDDYTVEYNAQCLKDAMFGIHSYPLFVRDLIHSYQQKNQDILPNLVINNEEKFKEWVNE